MYSLSYKYHEESLLNQLLSAEGLSLSWFDIILPIIYRVVNSVHPDVKNDGDDMDVRQYVQFKKVILIMHLEAWLILMYNIFD